MLDLLWRVRFRRKLQPRQVDRRHDLRHGREHRRPRGRRHPGLRPAARLRPPHARSTARRVHLRRRARRVPLPGRSAAAVASGQVHRGGRRLPSRRRDLQRLPGQGAAAPTSDRGRIIQRSLHADYLDRVRGYHATEAYKKAMRKRQVWVEPLFAEAKDWHGLRRFRLARPGERQYRGTADRGRAEPEALPGRDRLGPAPCPVREPRGPSRGAREALSRLWVTISSTRMRAIRSVKLRIAPTGLGRRRHFSTG